MKLIIAIDGPAGTGKSSIARLAAKHMGYIYVETGAIYRALAFVTAQKHIDPNHVDKILAELPRINISVDNQNFCTRVIIDGKIIEQELRSELISRLSSVISQDKQIRDALLHVQRDLVNQISTGAIFEGRDIGTVVFPKALLKIFVTATSETRAQRRYEQLDHEKSNITYEEVLDSIKKRDDRDKNRLNSPLQKAPDAITIDTSHLSLEQVLDQTIRLINQTKTKTKNLNLNQGHPLW